MPLGENGLNGPSDEKRVEQSWTGHLDPVYKQHIGPLAPGNQQAQIASVGAETDSTAIPVQAPESGPLVRQIHDIPGAVLEVRTGPVGPVAVMLKPTLI